MAKGPARVTIVCPHCRGTQEEYAHARSTFCRKCGRHVDLQQQSAVPVPLPEGAEEEGQGVLDRLSRLFTREKIRHICCLHCGAEQSVSTLAKSGSCTQCNLYLDFRDLKIDGLFSKTVETHGVVTITKSGDVTSQKVACAAAIVQGKVQGNLFCSTTAEVSTRGKLLGSIEAKNLIIDKKADVDFVRAVHVGAAEINGKISARIFADSVTINKTGCLEGAVTAKSIKIEKGGIFHGELFIGQQKQEQQELLPPAEKPARKKRESGENVIETPIDNPMVLRPVT